jgi:hypothetical protein
MIKSIFSFLLISLFGLTLVNGQPFSTLPSKDPAKGQGIKLAVAGADNKGYKMDYDAMVENISFDISANAKPSVRDTNYIPSSGNAWRNGHFYKLSGTPFVYFFDKNGVRMDFVSEAGNVTKISELLQIDPLAKIGDKLVSKNGDGYTKVSNKKWLCSKITATVKPPLTTIVNGDTISNVNAVWETYLNPLKPTVKTLFMCDGSQWLPMSRLTLASFVGNSQSDITADARLYRNYCYANKIPFEFGIGSFLISDSIRFDSYSKIVGESNGFSIVYFNPSVSGKILFALESTSRSADFITIKDVRVYGISSVQGVVVSAINTSRMDIDNLFINGNQNGGCFAGTGLLLKGREFGNVTNFFCYAYSPIKILNNPIIQFIDIDHFNFNNLVLATANNGTLVEIENGVSLTNVQFGGYQSWLAAKNGFLWNDLSSVGVSSGLTVSNVRWEQETDSTGFIVKISHNTALQNVLIERLYGGVTNNGIYLNKCELVNLKNIYHVNSDQSDTSLFVSNCYSLKIENFSASTKKYLPSMRKVQSKDIYNEEYVNNANFNPHVIDYSALSSSTSNTKSNVTGFSIKSDRGNTTPVSRGTGLTFWDGYTQTGMLAGVRKNAGSDWYGGLRFMVNKNNFPVSNEDDLSDVGSINYLGNWVLGGNTADDKAILDLQATNKGVLLPRLTATQRDGISSPPEGLEIYNLTLKKKQVYNGTAWETITSTSN